MNATSDTQRLIRELRRDGWTVTPTGSGHYKAMHPNGGFVILAASPRGPRWQQNTRACIRRVERNAQQPAKEGT
ncbi:hypothetical protein GobsT_50150 [Gemmata obscuriglobus]|uniref:hypothetical protein n=1 Tax=Gemmata obscuriglobus TaxID=114 RepID=UPI0011CCE54E|nr:hypothetical protein [Gemmata obscuriglobus]QEG30212.1 hypothetical protein GobsT_50150 [Gemmata obscuriglobus]VTS09536.1 ---NA--- : [Gemmata obscuriglobus UQM 2246]